MMSNQFFVLFTFLLYIHISIGFKASKIPNLFQLLASTGSNNEGSICCIKPEWEGLMYLDFGTVFIDTETAFSYINGSVRTAYSFDRKKVYMGMTGMEQSPLIPKPEPYDTIMLYDFLMNKMYTVQGGSCEKSEIGDNMTLMCIPKDASHLSSGRLTPGGVPIDTYQFRTDTDIGWFITADVHIDSAVPSGPSTCDPVHVRYFAGSANPDSGSLYGLQVLDMGPIKSSDIFDIPKACRHL